MVTQREHDIMCVRKKRDEEAPAGEQVRVSKHAARDVLYSHGHSLRCHQFVMEENLHLTIHVKEL